MWDGFNRLREVRDKNGSLIASYLYDADNRRVRKDLATGTDVDYHYAGWRVLAEYENGGSNPKRHFVYGIGLDEALVMDVNEDNDEYTTEGVDSRYFYHQNTLGSVYGLSNEDGDIIEAYEYDPYGKHWVIYNNGSALTFTSSDSRTTQGLSNYGNPYLFTGQRFDTESKLHYYKNRYYNPYTGRFISRDPIGYLGGANLYGYVGGSPTYFIDPLGLCQDKDDDYTYFDFYWDIWVDRGYGNKGPKGCYSTKCLDWRNNRFIDWYHKDSQSPLSQAAIEAALSHQAITAAEQAAASEALAMQNANPAQTFKDELGYHAEVLDAGTKFLVQTIWESAVTLSPDPIGEIKFLFFGGVLEEVAKNKNLRKIAKDTSEKVKNRLSRRKTTSQIRKDPCKLTEAEFVGEKTTPLKDRRANWVRPINGRAPINSSKYAGRTVPLEDLPVELRGKYPHSVHFSKAGFPDFWRYSIKNVRIELGSSRAVDFGRADKLAGFSRSFPRPKGYTWHHHQEAGRMQLVPTDLHNWVKHTGGIAANK